MNVWGQKSVETVSIVMGNKQIKNSVAIRDIPGVICDNQGNQILPIKMTNVALVPDCAFNLFSISIRLKQEWSLGGDANALELVSPTERIESGLILKYQCQMACCLPCM